MGVWPASDDTLALSRVRLAPRHGRIGGGTCGTLYL
jgi:hypothetical protein